MDYFRNLVLILPVMFYYLIESMFMSIFVFFAWRFVIYPACNVHVTYMQWVVILWIIKVAFFDVFKLLSGISTLPKEEAEKANDNDNPYNTYN